LWLLKGLQQTVGSLQIHVLGILDDKYIIATLKSAPGRSVLERTDLLNDDRLLARGPLNQMYVGVVAMQHFATRQACIAGVQRSDTGVGTSCTQQSLSKTKSTESLADTRRASKQIGVAHLLSSQCAPQDINRMFVADNIPTRGWRVICD